MTIDSFSSGRLHVVSQKFILFSGNFVNCFSVFVELCVLMCENWELFAMF